MNENNDYILICAEPAVVEINKYDSFMKVNNKLVSLGDSEWQVLIALAQNPRKYVSRKKLLNAISWDISKDYVTSENVRFYALIRELRKKFRGLTGNRLIESCQRLGYIIGRGSEQTATLSKQKEIIFSQEEFAFFFKEPYLKMLDAIAKHPFMSRKLTCEPLRGYQKRLKHKIKMRKFSYSELLGLFKSVIIRG